MSKRSSAADRAPAPAALTITGELTIQTAGEQHGILMAAIQQEDQGDAIGIDLAQVTELDTAGVQLLLLARREAAQLGKQIILIQPAQPVLDVLAIADLDTSLNGSITGTL